jgi:hypothetical protein
MNQQPFSGRFNRLIGLSPITPTCQGSELSSDDISKVEYIDKDGVSQPAVRALYATDIDSLNLDFSEALEDCSVDSIWQLLFASRASGLLTMEADLLAAFESLNRKNLETFRGPIGQEQGKGYLTTLKEGDRVAVNLQTRNLPGAFLKITRIGLVVSHDVDVQVSVPGLSTPVTVVCSANTASYTTLEKPLFIDLDGGSKSFSYTINGFRPKANTLNCGCGGQQERINQYLDGLVDAPAFGLLMQAEAGCDVLHSVYHAYEDGGSVSRVLAVTLRLITLANAVQRIISSPEISRYTMMERDQLYGKRAAYLKDYNDRINWLATDKGVDLSTTVCYSCQVVASRLNKRGILS